MDSESIKKMLRAVLQSSKAGVLISSVQSEYRALCGENIPFKKLGFSKLEDFLRSIPSVVRLENRKGEVRTLLFFLHVYAPLREPSAQPHIIADQAPSAMAQEQAINTGVHCYTINLSSCLRNMRKLQVWVWPQNVHDSNLIELSEGALSSETMLWRVTENPQEYQGPGICTRTLFTWSVSGFNIVADWLRIHLFCSWAALLQCVKRLPTLLSWWPSRRVLRNLATPKLSTARWDSNHPTHIRSVVGHALHSLIWSHYCVSAVAFILIRVAKRQLSLFLFFPNNLF